MMLEWTRETLDNGLDVIVHEDRRCPIVAVNLWYHVGSRNESPGRTGLAHLFEHLMFEGSLHHDANYFTPLQEAGAAVNGSTSCDRTNYWEVVPANALDLALWLESDRMGHLLPVLTAEKFDNQREVVLNERRQQYENRPYGMALMALMAALFPPEHPYHWTTIGEVADLRAATLEDARAFFRAWYHPGNASLTVAGDVETGAAMAAVRRHFEEIPDGPPGSRAGRPRDGSSAPVSPDPPGGKDVCCSRTAWSCRGCTWPGGRRRSSTRATPGWTCSPTSSPAARPRGCTGRWCTTAASPPTSAPPRARGS